MQSRMRANLGFARSSRRGHGNERDVRHGGTPIMAGRGHSEVPGQSSEMSMFAAGPPRGQEVRACGLVGEALRRGLLGI
jgi:hypothetical protein